MKVFMTALGKLVMTLVLAGLVLPCRIRAEELRNSPRAAGVQAEVQSGLRNGRAGGYPSVPRAVPVKKAGSASGKSLKQRPGQAAEPAGTADMPAAVAPRPGDIPVAETAVPPPGDESGADTGGDSPGGLDLAALEEELGRILDEGIEEALAEQRRAFEKEYARLWDSRSFWRRVAVGEGGAIVACLLGGFLVWNWSGR